MDSTPSSLQGHLSLTFEKAKELLSSCCSIHVTVFLLMAQSTRSVESLVKLTYALQIATRCSEDAEQICKKNHLTFPDLLRPFSVVSDKSKYGHQAVYLVIYSIMFNWVKLLVKIEV